MKNKIIIIILCMLIVGCANKNWEYVRIEGEVPAANCIYKMQESCSQKTNTCLNWHKKRAVSFGADTVVITHSEKLQNYATSAWTGRVNGSENACTIAEYYYCNGPKNIKPPQ